MTCVGMGFGLGLALWRTQQRLDAQRVEVGRLHEENHRLREEYGEFNVEDPSRLYAAQINRDETSETRMLDWRWRVYTPTPAVLHYTHGGVSKEGLPTPDCSDPIVAGYHTISLRYHPELYNEGEDWRTEIVIRTRARNANGTRTLSLRPDEPTWPPSRFTAETKWPAASPIEGVNWGRVTVGDDQSQVFDKPVVLQRVLVQPGEAPPPRSNGHAEWLRSLKPDAKTPGFVIWLEPDGS